MAKDPNYDRYAGMKSLPGPDGKLPRPFRVDEDGNVIYRDEERGIGQPMSAGKSRDLARAGILSWDELDRKLDRQMAPPTGEVLATASRGSAGTGGQESGVIRTRKTIGTNDYYVISANTFDPARSNGKTAIPNADMIATMKADMNQVAVTDRRAKDEKGGFTIRLPLDFSAKAEGPVNERNLPLINPKAEMYYSLPIINPETGETSTANTLKFGTPDTWPIGTAALNHGHIDKGLKRSDGMIDDWDPLHTPKPIVGDVGSLRGDAPIPTATVSKGRIGWHQLEEGRLQFMYPVEMALSDHEAREIQNKLNLQQSLFHRKIP